MFSQSKRYDPFGFPLDFSSSYGSRQQREFARIEEERRRRAEIERRKRVEEEKARRRQMNKLVMERGERARRGERKLRNAAFSGSSGTAVRGLDGNLYRVGEMEMKRGKGGESWRSLPTKQQPQNLRTSYPPGTIVRGPDGNLYRVPAPPTREIEPSDADIGSDSAFVDGLFGPVLASDENKEKQAEEVLSTENRGVDEPMDTTSHDFEEQRETEDVRDSSRTKSVNSDVSDQNQHDIVVETVPDDEDEEIRELRSVWRNRVPSPGQWMEPVEAFNGR